MFLGREGIQIGKERCARLWYKAELQVPAKPQQNGTNESFNGKFREECLSMEWFRNRLEARGIIEDWRRHYNDVRLHSSLNYLIPRQFVGTLNNVI